MFTNSLVACFAGFFYLSRHNEVNRLKRFVFSIDMLVNVGSRALLAFVATDFVSRKLFVNYDKILRHKVAVNEVKKMMRTYPNAKPHRAVHEKPNSYYFAQDRR